MNKSHCHSVISDLENSVSNHCASFGFQFVHINSNSLLARIPAFETPRESEDWLTQGQPAPHCGYPPPLFPGCCLTTEFISGVPTVCRGTPSQLEEVLGVLFPLLPPPTAHSGQVFLSGTMCLLSFPLDELDHWVLRIFSKYEASAWDKPCMPRAHSASSELRAEGVLRGSDPEAKGRSSREERFHASSQPWLWAWAHESAAA